MKWTLQAAKDEPMEEVFGLYEKRVEWMKQRGLRQWDAGYLRRIRFLIIRCSGTRGGFIF